ASAQLPKPSPLSEFMNNTLQDKIVVVTGGARGLGAALCERLVHAGAKVVVADLRLELAQETCARILAGAPDHDAVIFPYSIDIDEQAQVETVVRCISSRRGAIHNVITDAGIDVTLSIDEMTVDAFDRVVLTKLRGPFLLSK